MRNIGHGRAREADGLIKFTSEAIAPWWRLCIHGWTRVARLFIYTVVSFLTSFLFSFLPSYTSCFLHAFLSSPPICRSALLDTVSLLRQPLVTCVVTTSKWTAPHSTEMHTPSLFYTTMHNPCTAESLHCKLQ